MENLPLCANSGVEGEGLKYYGAAIRKSPKSPKSLVYSSSGKNHTKLRDFGDFGD